MRSIAVTKMGFYECEFNSQGVFLTMISDAEAKANIGGPWYYMMPGQYVEGTSYLDSMVKTETSTVTTLVPPSGQLFYRIYRGTPNQTEITFEPPKLDSEVKPKHTCSDFKWYYGLLEHYEYCVSCEKKR